MSIYRYRSWRIRTNEALIAAITCLTPGGIATFATTGNWRTVIGIATVTLTCYAMMRARRLDLIATRSDVMIVNYWRSHKLAWSDISDVGVGAMAMGVLPQPAFKFRLNDGRTVGAQSTPFQATGQAVVMKGLENLAPPTIRFHPPQGIE